MIGDKRLEMPKDVDSCRVIMHNFNMVWPDSTKDLMHNAKRLVELNNEVYGKLHKTQPIDTQYARDAREQAMINRHNQGCR